MLQSTGGGGASSWSLLNLGPRMLKGDFAPGFFIEHFLKDLGIMLSESRRMELMMPGTALVEQLYRARPPKATPATARRPCSWPLPK